MSLAEPPGAPAPPEAPADAEPARTAAVPVRTARMVHNLAASMAKLRESGQYDVETVLADAARRGVGPLRALADAGVPHRLLQRAVWQHRGYPLVSLTTSSVAMGLFEQLPLEVCEARGVVPYDGYGSATVAVSDPTDIAVIDELRGRLGPDARFVVAEATDIRRVLQSVGAQATSAGLTLEGVGEDRSRIVDIEQFGASEGEVAQLVNSLVVQAASSFASDVHIEPSLDSMDVRFRIDGVLHHMTRYPASVTPGVVNRLKVLGQPRRGRPPPPPGRPLRRGHGRHPPRPAPGDPADHLGDGGRGDPDPRPVPAGVRAGGPGLLALGARVLQPPVPAPPRLGAGHRSDRLGQDHHPLRHPGPHRHQRDQGARRRGPGGDPASPTATQVQVNVRAGLTFATALRSFVRADPDIILVGEVRDLETALVSTEAALTGHLVLASLHANNAPRGGHPAAGDGHRRLSGGVVAAGRGVAAGCCAACAATAGCPTCSGPSCSSTWYTSSPCPPRSSGPGKAAAAPAAASAYRGRTAVAEVVEMDEEMSAAIAASRPGTELMDLAVAAGMVPMRDDGLVRVMQGQTSVSEVARVVN